jgi:MSHA biogenesis protein MshJ
MKNRPALLVLTVLFEQKPLRERVLMLFASLALTFFMIDTFLVTPQTKRFKQLTVRMEGLHDDTEKTAQLIASLTAELAQHSDVNKKAELEKLISQIAETDALLSEEDGNSLKLSALLSSLLETTPGVQLMSLKTLPVLPLLPRAPLDAEGKPAQKLGPPMIAGSVQEAPPATVYQHGVEITIKGNYLALLPYLEKIKRYPKRLFWLEAKLEVAKYPHSVLRLTLHTLSEQKVTSLQ